MTHPPIAPARASDLGAVRTLFRDYAASLDVDLAFQGFEAELAALPGAYAAPSGVLLLAGKGEPLGCVAVRPLPLPGTCEVKRLYVRPAGRGTGLGRALAGAALGFAEGAGYRRVLLDTLPSMAAAAALYRSMGFAPAPPYGTASVPGMLYFEKALTPPVPS